LAAKSDADRRTAPGGRPQRLFSALPFPRARGVLLKEIWVEKYRPQRLSDVVGQREVVERLQAYVKTGNLPHLLFAGPAGTGKTTCAIALSKELFGEDWRSNFQELNASDERGIDIVRGKIKEIASLRPMGTHPFKILFLDEADNLTADAQAALRRTMETFTRTTRFILSCNYSSRIIEPIQSRTAVFRFRPLPKEDVAAYARRVAKAEKLELAESGLEALAYLAQGDLRRATNALQVAAAVSTKIDGDSLYKVASTARPEEIKRLLEVALQGEFTRARDVLDEVLIEYGLSGEDILRQIHRTVFDLALPDEAKVRIVDQVGEAEFRLVEGSNERIQLESLIAHLALVGRELRKA
jgi:replication factor C small subunit